MPYQQCLSGSFQTADGPTGSLAEHPSCFPGGICWLLANLDKAIEVTSRAISLMNLFTLIQRFTPFEKGCAKLSSSPKLFHPNTEPSCFKEPNPFPVLTFHPGSIKCVDCFYLIVDCFFEWNTVRKGTDVHRLKLQIWRGKIWPKFWEETHSSLLFSLLCLSEWVMPRACGKHPGSPRQHQHRCRSCVWLLGQALDHRNMACRGLLPALPCW